MPDRIQQKRTRGWRKPENTVSVARPTKWGNPWKVGSRGWVVIKGGIIDRTPHPPLTRVKAVESFRHSMEYHLKEDPDYLAELRGKNLMCYCPLDQPCHADVLLELANR